ncbi:MAG: DUF1080 domain-containing protein [Tannerellaceae bacterium]|jgi:hypothetical protein|nr:DUF1080 domain-containing protein [Tannerellaceae bacterium]
MNRNIAKYLSLMSFLVLTLASCQSNDGWTYLFNGKDLTGFRQLNGQAPFEVIDGCIVGTSVMEQPNSFLATEKDYGDFILEFEVLCDNALNSGVQFRSLSLPDYRDGRVHGYQCEIDPSDRAWSGGIYDEARKGWLVTLGDNPAGRAAYKKNDWNKYRIEALSDTIRIWLNGVNTANLLDNESLSGFIALQVHQIYNNEMEGKQIKWRNIRIKTDGLQFSNTSALAPEINRIPNTLSAGEQSEGWKLLFDGKTNEGWRGAHKEAFPEYGWTIADGAITVSKDKGGEATNGGDIVYAPEEFAAFELSVEFKITKGANSGIKYYVTEKEKASGSAFGLEYQILDDNVHPDAKLYTTVPGSRCLAGLYDLIKPVNIRFNGVGNWNQAVIKAYPNNHVEHWLNGFKTVEYERSSDAFRDLVKGSKYAAPQYNEHGNFGEAPSGRILLQDHGDEVSFRSIKIRTLN